MTTEDTDREAASDLLKSKAMLLLRRERELLEFRMERDRVAAWLDVFHSLSKMLGEVHESAILAESSAMLVNHLGFELVTVYRHDTGDKTVVPVCTQPRGRTVETIPVCCGGQSPMLESKGGTQDVADPADHARVCDATGLAKYFWLSFPLGHSHYHLIAGFSPHSAAFQSLTASDEGHFIMFGNHLRALLLNSKLVEELHSERQDLEATNRRLTAEMDERERIESELRMSHKLEAVGQLAAGIAHEINTPIQYIGDNTSFVSTAFAAYAALIDRLTGSLDSLALGATPEQVGEEVAAAMKEADLEFLNEEVPDAIAQSLEGIERVASIVYAMREFAHPGSREKTSVDLNRAIETSLTVSRNEWKYVAEVETDLEEDLPSIPAYAGEINQVLLNLIVNAAHAIAEVVADNEEKGVILISTRREGDWVEVQLSDTGTGIPEEIQQDIFTPFFTTKDVGKGTGQGLALARTVIVDKHGGTLDVESAVGEGATFVIRLPLCPTQQDGSEDSEALEDRACAAAPI